ncbi:protein translocase subunit SecF [Gammaproteobacteria bacterium LSUCC0057]|uniref:Protein-export membrane protein SecF n=1 Tax=Gammaproteobacteria bacterium LSUCC0057 TaxID=2559237 RepID=A0A4Y8UJ09_9GAMM|nr:protein translocase subunit SecF [Gammaproteobacteria bacterium LSUCC0057]
MQQIKIYNFMAPSRAMIALSSVLLLVSVISLATRGIHLGLDFSGGTQIEVGYPQPVAVEQIRQQLVEAGFNSPTVVHFGAETDILLRLKEIPVVAQEALQSDSAAPDIGQRVVTALSAEGAEIELRRIDYVGPQIGEELREEGGLGMLVALAVVMLYVAVRFQFKFALGAVLALAHDVILTLGFFSLTQLEFDLTVLAAVLAVIGYSLNDTIIVFDRVRENFRKLRKTEPVDVINESLSQTLWRTLNTSFTTLLVLLALFIFGGELIHNFAAALLFGILVGTYSSIYVAAKLLLLLNISREDLLQPVEGELVDDLP